MAPAALWQTEDASVQSGSREATPIQNLNMVVNILWHSNRVTSTKQRNVTYTSRTLQVKKAQNKLQWNLHISLPLRPVFPWWVVPWHIKSRGVLSYGDSNGLPTGSSEGWSNGRCKMIWLQHSIRSSTLNKWRPAASTSCLLDCNLTWNSELYQRKNNPNEIIKIW